MAMQGRRSRQWQPQAATTLQRPGPGRDAAAAAAERRVVVGDGGAGRPRRAGRGGAGHRPGHEPQQQQAGTTPTSRPHGRRCRSLIGKTEASRRRPAAAARASPSIAGAAADSEPRLRRQGGRRRTRRPAPQCTQNDPVTYQLCTGAGQGPGAEQPGRLHRRTNAEQTLTRPRPEPGVQAGRRRRTRRARSSPWRTRARRSTPARTITVQGLQGQPGPDAGRDRQVAGRRRGHPGEQRPFNVSIKTVAGRRHPGAGHGHRRRTRPGTPDPEGRQGRRSPWSPTPNPSAERQRQPRRAGRRQRRRRRSATALGGRSPARTDRRHRAAARPRVGRLSCEGCVRRWRRPTRRRVSTSAASGGRLLQGRRQAAGRQPVRQHGVPALGEHRLRVELHALDRQRRGAASPSPRPIRYARSPRSPSGSVSGSTASEW